MLKSHLIKTSLILLGVLSFINQPLKASYFGVEDITNELVKAKWVKEEGSMAYSTTDGDLRVHPFGEKSFDEDFQIFSLINSNSQVCKLFRDHKTRTAEQMRPQAEGWDERRKNGIPTYGWIVSVKHEQDMVPVGYVVIGGSTIPGYFELAGAGFPGLAPSIHNPIIFEDDENTTYESEYKNTRIQKETRPLYNQKIGQKVLGFLLDIHLKTLRETLIINLLSPAEEYIGHQFKGIIATSENPAAIHILEKAGFKNQGTITNHGFAKAKYQLDFPAQDSGIEFED